VFTGSILRGIRSTFTVYILCVWVCMDISVKSLVVHVKVLVVSTRIKAESRWSSSWKDVCQHPHTCIPCLDCDPDRRRLECFWNIVVYFLLAVTCWSLQFLDCRENLEFPVICFLELCVNFECVTCVGQIYFLLRIKFSSVWRSLLLLAVNQVNARNKLIALLK